MPRWRKCSYAERLGVFLGESYSCWEKIRLEDRHASIGDSRDVQRWNTDRRWYMNERARGNALVIAKRRYRKHTDPLQLTSSWSGRITSWVQPSSPYYQHAPKHFISQELHLEIISVASKSISLSTRWRQCFRGTRTPNWCVTVNVILYPISTDVLSRNLLSTVGRVATQSRLH